MPSISLFIKQLLAEDKYSADFSERIDERIGTLNAAQLQGMYNHLITTAKLSKCELWSGANMELIRRIESTLKARVAEEAAVNMALEEEDLRHQQKERMEREAKQEKKRVMQMIAQTARDKAEKEVRDEEQKRQTDEKVQIIQRVFNGEERRNRWWAYTASSCAVTIAIVIVAAIFTPFSIPFATFVVIGAIVLIVLTGGFLVYYASAFTTVLPLVVEESELERRIAERVDFYKKKAIENLKEKERKFQLQERQDEIDRRERKRARKRQLKFEAELLEARRKENIAMAKEVLSRQPGEQGHLYSGVSTISGSEVAPQFSWDYQSQSVDSFGGGSSSSRFSEVQRSHSLDRSSIKIASANYGVAVDPIQEADGKESSDRFSPSSDIEEGCSAAWRTAAASDNSEDEVSQQSQRRDKVDTQQMKVEDV